MPPMQLLYPTAHPGSDRRPPRTGLARARFHNPSNKEVIITQDCTVAPAHFQGTPYREPIPEDVSVLAHSTLLPQVGDQPGPFRQGQQVLSLQDQQCLRLLPCRPMCPLAGYTVAPLQGLPVQVGRVGEAHTEPHIAPGVPDLALHLAIGLGMEGQVQPYLETYLQGEILHPPVPFRPAGRIPAHHHLGLVVQPAPLFVYVDTSHNEGMGGDGRLVRFALILYAVLGGLCISPIACLCLNTRLIAGFHV